MSSVCHIGDVRRARAVLCAALLVLGGCGGVHMPKVSMPKLGDVGEEEQAADVTATPRDLLTAKLANPKANPDTPGMTVGKLIEYADRYLACDCAGTRFVRAWEKTPVGYRLLTNSGVVQPLDFVCKEDQNGRSCYLREIDRGEHTAAFDARFVPGSDFIQFLYDNGVRCEREEPCP